MSRDLPDEFSISLSEEVVDKGLLMSYDELRILLYASGVKEIEGVYMPEHTYMPEEVLGLLAHMTKKGILEAREDGFEMRGDIRRLIDIMIKPKETIILNSVFAYITDCGVVLSEKYWKKKDMLRLQMLTPKEYQLWKELGVDDNSRN